MAIPSDKQPIMAIQHISKRFDATQALEDVALALYPGEVHALIGENGAGKSTLIKIMTGVHPPDQGEICWMANRSRFATPRKRRPTASPRSTRSRWCSPI